MAGAMAAAVMGGDGAMMRRHSAAQRVILHRLHPIRRSSGGRAAKPQHARASRGLLIDALPLASASGLRCAPRSLAALARARLRPR